MAKGILSMVAMHIVLLFVLVGSISLVFDLGRYAFLLELLVVGVLILLGITAIVGLANYFSWVWKFLIGYFILVGLNLLFIYLISPVDWFMFKLAGYSALIGFVIALLMMSTEPDNSHKKDDEYEIEEPEKPKKEAKTVSVSHSPGKYVASKSGSTYHAPKCDWGKRINPKNRVWYGSKADAERDGNKSCNACK